MHKTRCLGKCMLNYSDIIHTSNREIASDIKCPPPIGKVPQLTPPCDSTSPYDCRKFSHNLPTNCTLVPFECFVGIPTGVFRCTQGETLGAGASKCGMYKQVEYFSFHHHTFQDMHIWLSCCRQPQVESGRKPINYNNF